MPVGQIHGYRTHKSARAQSSRARAFCSSFSVGQPTMTACLGWGFVSGSIASCDSTTALAWRSARAIAFKFLGCPATSSPICQISASRSSSIQNTEVWRSRGDGINADGFALFLVKCLVWKMKRERVVFGPTGSTSNVLLLSRRL